MRDVRLRDEVIKRRSSYRIVRISCHFFEPCLDALHDSANSLSVLATLFALEDDARMSDDGHRLTARQQEIAKDGAM